MDIRRGIFILNQDEKIIFYSGDLHEVSTITFEPEKLIGENPLSVFNSEIVSKITFTKNDSGYFDYKNHNYIYRKKNLTTPVGESLILFEIEGESDENVSFYSMLIHEIKNPLAAVRTLVQALADYILDDLKKVSSDSVETAIDYFTRITSEIDRLNRLLTSVKYIAKHIQVLHVPFDIIRVANNTINVFEDVLKERNIRLETDFSGESIIFYGDPDQFQQIFNNLISNAIEAIEEPTGKIIFAIMMKEDKSIYIEVKDQGVGIDKNDIGKIFKAFYSRKIGGMGIGLSVVKMIVKHYKGVLDINSKIGVGTTVSISLPPAEKIEKTDA